MSRRAVVAKKWLPLSGIVFVVVALVAVIGVGGNTPDTDASASKVASYYDAHNVRQSVAAFLLAASVPFLALFAIQLAAAFELGTASATVWSRLLRVGAAVAASVLLVGAAGHFALADAANNGVAGDGIRALNVLDADGWIAWNAGLGVLMLGVAGAVLQGARVLPRWLGWIALFVAVALFIPFADFVALLLTLIFILVTSVLLWRWHETATVTAPQPV
jgi:hypothetical protein